MILTLLNWSRPRAGSAVTIVLLVLLSIGARADGLADKVATCTVCHGAAGFPTRADVPIIWGQEFYYLYVQLKDYKAGRRQNAEMSGIAATLSKQEMQDLAQHFSSLAWPRTAFTADSTDIARGESATSAGLCVQCHLGGYEGNSRIPRLAGQQPAYLERTMLEFKNKVRMNSPAKASLLAAYEDKDIAAMAHYLAGY
jgi:cytochrome c553